MVLTITLNPLLEKKLYFKKIVGKSARAYKHEFLAGGKGINISRQLNFLGIQNHALLFLGGANGKKLRSIIENERISFSAVSTKEETREASLIYDDEYHELKTYFGVNSIISESEVDQFITKMEKAIINSSMVVFSGSLPSENTARIIRHGIDLCNKTDKISILDSYGTHLLSSIECGPTIIHNNKTEIRNSLKFPIDTEEEIRQVLDYLYEKNVKLAFITNGSDPAFASKSDFHYRIEFPKIEEIDSTGSGDAFLSGIIYGIDNSYVFNDFVKLGVSLGIQNALSKKTCSVSIEESTHYIDRIKIVEIGKKIKLIDDSPTI